MKLQSQAFQHFECFSLTGLYYDGTEPETLWEQVVKTTIPWVSRFEAFNLHADKLNKIISL